MGQCCTTAQPDNTSNTQQALLTENENKDNDNETKMVSNNNSNTTSIKTSISNDPQINKRDPKDLNTDPLFHTIHDNRCNGKEYSQCQCMKRLFVGLQYYSTLNITTNESDKEEWNTFINETYHNLIDDYIHFNNDHSHEIENINNEIMDNKTILS
eukprot:200706_1